MPIQISIKLKAAYQTLKIKKRSKVDLRKEIEDS